MSNEQVQHVFDRYWQARETSSKGSGLGLFISKGIIDGHGGKIWLESPFGNGSKVCFTLPLSKV